MSLVRRTNGFTAEDDIEKLTKLVVSLRMEFKSVGLDTASRFDFDDPKARKIMEVNTLVVYSIDRRMQAHERGMVHGPKAMHLISHLPTMSGTLGAVRNLASGICVGTLKGKRNFEIVHRTQSLRLETNLSPNEEMVLCRAIHW
ncbi:hypothetical protein CYMTET_56391 [Cymbomonas tetramitiformis]|uniref:Uncharacterized protein n=1 Tax=Cymbomonas tetramitiformis TaxID=36881 RepID=A0AAE0BC98_9CHLO|nr:hypothetical protein CYMTET_56391 [Cymbomonas tetramitiformis]